MAIIERAAPFINFSVMETKVDKNLELKKAINEYCQKKGISKNELSVQIGINSAYLSKIENEKFDDITEKMLNRIWSAIESRMTQTLYTTKDLQDVFYQCDFTRENRLMTGLIADTGFGKTSSLRAYSMQKNVFFVTVDKTMNAKRLLRAILKEMKIAFDGNTHDIMLKISEELNRLESPLLIIDEAGKLNHAMILYLHDLREYTRTNCGIILSGMPYFKSNLQKFADKQKEGYSEFYRRINVWHKLNGLSRAETSQVCQAEGVEGDYTEYYKLPFGNLMNKILLNKLYNKQ